MIWIARISLLVVGAFFCGLYLNWSMTDLLALAALACALRFLPFSNGVQPDQDRPALQLPALLTGLVAVAATLMLRYHAGPDTTVPIHDTVDGNLPRHVVMATLPITASLDAITPMMLGGVPKNSLHSDLTLYALLVRLFQPFTAYVIHETVVRLTAFAGFYLFSRDYAAPAAKPYLHFGAALGFSQLPFWLPGSLNIAGQPLLFWALFNLARGNLRPRNWLVIGLFPFASSLAIAGWADLLAVTGILLICTVRQRSFPWRLAASLLLLAGCYVIVEYRALYQLLFDADYISHRAEFGPPYFLLKDINTPLAFLRYFVEQLLIGNYYARAVQHPFIFMAAALPPGAIVMCAAARRLRLRPPERVENASGAAGGWTHFLKSKYALFWGLILFCLLADALGMYGPFKAWTLELPGGGGLNTINLRRLNRFLPFLWFALFCASLQPAANRLPSGKDLVTLLLAGQFLICFFQLTRHVPEFTPHGYFTTSYKDYYAESLFGRIKQWIGLPPDRYKVGCIGFFPGIANYNGLQTIGGYAPNYPLSYKHRFRRLIAGELDKSEWLRIRFDSWASYCFIIPAEARRLHKTLELNARIDVINIDLDPAALRDLGANYILSRAPIGNPAENGLAFERYFAEADTPWQVFLYRVDEEGSPRPDGKAGEPKPDYWRLMR